MARSSRSPGTGTTPGQKVYMAENLSDRKYIYTPECSDCRFLHLVGNEIDKSSTMDHPSRSELLPVKKNWS